MRDEYHLTCPDCGFRWTLEIAPGFKGSVDCPKCGLWQNVKSFSPRILHALAPHWERAKFYRDDNIIER